MSKRFTKITLLSLLLTCGCEYLSIGGNSTTSSNSSNSSSSISSSSLSNESSTNDFNSSSSSISTSQSSSSSTQTYKDILHSDWYIWASEGNSITKEDIDENSFILNIENNSVTDKWSTQCLNTNLNVSSSSTYRLEITLTSSVSRTIGLIFQEGSYSYYDLNEKVVLNANEETTFTFEFVAQETQTNMLFGIMTGKVGEEGYEGAQTLTVSNPHILLINEVIEIDEGPGEASKEDTPNKEGYNILWADEFNGDSINMDNWTFEYGNSGWGNNEYQYYTDREENAYLEDGALHIVARKESYGGARYTSARMITQDKVEFTYGYIEARIAVPSMQGIWPAYWMLGANFSDVGWPKCGEIDILEAINAEKNKVYSTLHWQYTPASSQADYGNDGATISNRTKYHLYAMNWTEEKIEILVDNEVTFSMGISGGNGLEAFQKDFFFILNVAVGGNWPGFTIADDFPQTMYVDYIRVYQPN